MRARLRFEQLACVDSTNAELMRRDADGFDDTPLALWALRQTAGRGRQGRVWHSDPQDAITVSVAVQVRAPVGALLGLPLAVGVSLAEGLEAQGARRMALKWPNDLYIQTDAGWAKTGGILTEVKSLSPSAVGVGDAGQAAQHRVVCGFGINLFAAPESLQGRHSDSPAGSVPAGAVFTEKDRAGIDRALLARELAAAVADCMQRFPRLGLAPWAQGWQARDLLAGRNIRVHHGEGRFTSALACGVDAHGALVIRDTEGRRRTLTSGEVSVRLDPQ